MDLHKRLQMTTLFVGLSGEELQKIIEIGELKTFQPNETLIVEGQAGNPLYVLLSGEVWITHEDGGTPTAITTVSGETAMRDQYTGDFVGEMSLLDMEAPSANVIAKTEVNTLALGQQGLGQILMDDPRIYACLMANISRTLSRRMREMNRLLCETRQPTCP